MISAPITDENKLVACSVMLLLSFRMYVIHVHICVCVLGEGGRKNSRITQPSSKPDGHSSRNLDLHEILSIAYYPCPIIPKPQVKLREAVSDISIKGDAQTDILLGVVCNSVIAEHTRR